jgi:hypothetical protein
MKQTVSFRFLRRILQAGLAFGLLIPAGCSDGRPKRVPVSGQVLIDGQPVESGYIRVLPEEARAATSALGTGGRFTLKTYEEGDGCVPGTHCVTVIAVKSLNSTTKKWFAPKKYANRGMSGLTIEVNGPRDDVEIHLTWKGSGHDQPFIERFEAEE